MSENSTESRNLGGIMLSGAAGKSQQHFPEKAPDDREEFEFLLRKGITKVGFFQEMQPYVFVSGDMAFVTYFSRGFYGEDEGQMAYFKETTILRKDSQQGWQIIHIHLSSS